MLVLSRSTDETIVIGGAVTVKVIDVRGEKVRLGVVGPREISIHRGEIQDQISKGESVMFDTTPSETDEEPVVVEESDMEKRMALLIRRLLEFRSLLPIGLTIESQQCLDDRKKNFQMGLVR